VSDRTPATEKGTADRIEADDGGYWVRLVTKQALKREGECMQNCLARGHYADTAGEEDLVSTAVWSLRKADGVSYINISVHVQRDDIFAGNAEGPKNSRPSGWSCRQLRHLVAAFRDAGATLRIHKGTALIGEDGRTWRPDKAPAELREAFEKSAREEWDRRHAEMEAVFSRNADGLEAARSQGDNLYAPYSGSGLTCELASMRAAASNGLISRDEAVRSLGARWEDVASRYGTLVTMDDVRRSRRYLPWAQAFVAGLCEALSWRRSHLTVSHVPPVRIGGAGGQSN